MKGSIPPCTHKAVLCCGYSHASCERPSAETAAAAAPASARGSTGPRSRGHHSQGLAQLVAPPPPSRKLLHVRSVRGLRKRPQY